MLLRLPHTFRRRFLRALALPLSVAVLGSAPLARAATVTWTGAGSDTSWQTALNWVNSAIPATGDSLYFGGSITAFTARNNAAPNALTLTGLTFNPGGAGDIVLSGSSFILNGNITDNRSGGTTTIQNTFTLPDNSTPTVNVGAGAFLTVTGNINGRNNVLTKTGAGTLTLTGSNNYTRDSIFSSLGRTDIQQGTIVIGNQYAIGNINAGIASDEYVSIASGAALNLNGYNINAGNITAGSTGSVDNGAIFVNTGAVNLNVKVGGSGGISTNTGAITTISSSNTYTGATGIYGGQLILNNASALGSTSSIVFQTGTLVYTAANTTDYSSKFQLAAVAGAVYSVDTGGQTVTFASDITAQQFLNPQLFKYGQGTLIITGTNAHLTALTIAAGAVRFSNTNNFGTGYVNLVTGGTLQWAAGSTADISSIVRLNGGALDTNGNNVTLAGVMSAGTLVKVGTGTLTLSNTNSYSGGTYVNGGVLKLTTLAPSIGAIRGALTIGSGATVETAGVDAFGYADNVKVDSVTIDGGTLNNTAAGNCGWGVAYTLSNGALMTSNGGLSDANTLSKFAFGGPAGGPTSVNATSGTSTIAGRIELRNNLGNTTANLTVATGATLKITAAITGTISDPGYGFAGFAKLGGGTLVLTGSNTYSGTTFASGGVIDFNNANAFGSGAPIIVGSGTLRWTSNSTDLSSRITLGAGGGGFDTNGNTVTFANALSGTGALTKIGSGLLRLSAQNAHSAGGDTTINGGVLALAGAATTHGQLGGSGAKITINSGNINLEADNALVGTSPFANIVLTINSGGLLSTVNNVTNLAGVVLNGGVIDTAGGGNFTTGNYLFNYGVSTAGTGTLSRIQGGAIVMSSTVSVKANDTLQISSVIMGNNNLVKGDVGTLALTGSNTFTGTTVVNGGLIEFSSNSAFGNAANKVILNGGGLRWAAGSTADISSRLNALGATGATFDTNGNNVILGSVISGSGALTKNGLGTLSLNAANTYTGGTVINSGTLVAAQNNALGSGSVRVQGGALNVQNGVTFSNSVVLAGGTYSRTLTGSLAGKVNAMSDLTGGNDTTASILAGSLAAQSTLVTSFASTSAATNDNLRQSDVYSFFGTGTNTFVLQLSSATAGDDGIVVWLDNGEWVNAINGNTGNTATQAMQGFNGSYSEFLAAFSSSTLAQTLGAYGYDVDTQSAWAVLNHNSDFAIIPEPATVGLLLAGGALLVAFRRRRAA